MAKIEILNEYDFHDSLLERFIHDKEHNNIILEIDLCNWKQAWYDEKEETSMISLIFENISDIIVPEFVLNSDEIIKFEVLSGKGVKLVAFNDIKNSCYEMIIYAKSVQIKSH